MGVHPPPPPRICQNHHHHCHIVFAKSVLCLKQQVLLTFGIRSPEETVLLILTAVLNISRI